MEELSFAGTCCWVVVLGCVVLCWQTSFSTSTEFGFPSVVVGCPGPLSESSRKDLHVHSVSSSSCCICSFVSLSHRKCIQRRHISHYTALDLTGLPHMPRESRVLFWALGLWWAPRAGTLTLRLAAGWSWCGSHIWVRAVLPVGQGGWVHTWLGVVSACMCVDEVCFGGVPHAVVIGLDY